MGQEHEFFQSQRPKEDVCPVGPKEEAGRVTGTASAPALAPGVCLSCFPWERVEACPLPWSEVGVSLVSGRWQLEGKKPSGYLCRAGPLVAEGGFCCRGS